MLSRIVLKKSEPGSVADLFFPPIRMNFPAVQQSHLHLSINPHDKYFDTFVAFDTPFRICQSAFLGFSISLSCLSDPGLFLLLNVGKYLTFLLMKRPAKELSDEEQGAVMSWNQEAKDFSMI